MAKLRKKKNVHAPTTKNNHFLTVYQADDRLLFDAQAAVWQSLLFLPLS
jgi:hypothetical protein